VTLGFLVQRASEMAEAVSLSLQGFGTDIRLLCRDTWNFFVRIALFVRRDMALFQRYLAPWPRDSARLRTTPGSVSTQGHMGVISSLLLHSRSPQHTATHCNTLQHTATHCNAQQHTAIHCLSPQGDMGVMPHWYPGTYLKTYSLVLPYSYV